MNRFFAAAIAFGCLVSPMVASAQSDAPIDSIGHLTEMPFELDISYTRMSVDRGEDYVSFVHYTNMNLDDVVEHYEDYLASHRELAPGWEVIGRSFNIGTSQWWYTVMYASQRYILEIEADTGGGAIVTLRGEGSPLGWRPYLHTIMPYRCPGIGAIEYLTQ